MSPLQQIAIDCGEPDLPQKIYNACLNKQAFLFVVERAGCVLRPMVIDGVTGVLVWVAWSDRPDGMAVYTDFIKQRAVEIGAKWLRFHTIRRGFCRAATKFGWERLPDDADGFMVFQLRLGVEHGEEQ